MTGAPGNACGADRHRRAVGSAGHQWRHRLQCTLPGALLCKEASPRICGCHAVIALLPDTSAGNARHLCEDCTAVHSQSGRASGFLGQVLGDLATVQDHKRQLAGLRIALVSAGGPVTASWLRAAKVLRLALVCICPPGHEPDMTTVRLCNK